ncbi:MAG: hypothetical protein ACW981_13125 [Candidatus Hodarchaeales archaeon]
MNESVCFSCYQVNSSDALFCEFCGINLQLAQESYENEHLTDTNSFRTSKIMFLLTSPNHSFERYFLIYFFPFYFWMVLYLSNTIFGLIDGNPFLFDLVMSVNSLKWVSIILYFLIPLLFGYYYLKEQDILNKRIISSKIVISIGFSFLMFLILTFIDNSIYQIHSANQFPVEEEIISIYSQILLILGPITLLLTLIFIGIIIWFFKFFNPKNLNTIQS